MALSAGPAAATVLGSHVVAAIPASSTLELSGYPPGADLSIDAIRDGMVIGHATTKALPDGSAGINPVDCWQGTTPQLLPGDTISVAGAGPTDTMVVQDVNATAMDVDPANGNVLVHGTAIAPGGGPFDPRAFSASVQARISRPAGGGLFSNGRNSLRAGAGKFDGTIAYDPPTADDPTPTTWTARFPLSSTDAANALGAKNFEGVFLVGLSELTIGRFPVAAPAAGCPPIQRNGVTGFGRPAVNEANVATPVIVSGVAQPDVTSVAVTLADAFGHKISVPAATPSGGIWSAPAADVSALHDGTLTATPTMTSATSTFTGAEQTITKDVVAPPAPVASLSPGTYPPRGSSRSATTTPRRRCTSPPRARCRRAPRRRSPRRSPSPTARRSGRSRSTRGQPQPGRDVRLHDRRSRSRSAPTPEPPGTGGGGTGGSTTTIIQRFPVVVTLPAGTATTPASAPSRPAVRRLSVAVTHRRALRVAMRLDRGTAVVRVRAYRSHDGQRAGAPLLTLLRVPRRAGRYVLTIRSARLRLLRPGRYLLDVQAGATRGALGARADKGFTIA